VLYSFSPGLEFLDLARLVAGEHDDVDAASAQCSRRFDRPRWNASPNSACHFRLTY